MSAEDTLALDLLLDPSWILRRKETLELLSERLVRHRVTVDFRAPDLGDQCAVLPLFVLRKAPGAFTEFDFVDSSGTSLSLPGRAENVEGSTKILLAAAERELEALPEPLTLTPRLRRELKFIASSGADDSIAQLLHEWPSRDPVRTSTFRLRFWRHRAVRRYPANKVALMNSPTFAWLVWMLARNSIVALPDDAAIRSCRILKLVYVEEVTDLVSAPASRPIPRLMRMIGRLFYRLGWRGYPIAVQIPCAGARTFHFEMHAPDGVEILDAGVRETGNIVSKGVRSRVHLYEPDALAAKELTAYIQTRIRGAGFAGSAALTATFIAASIWLAWQFDDKLAGRQLGALHLSCSCSRD